MNLRPDDHIVVAIEYCSSSQHPWTDREVQKLIPQDRPVHIITTNPDRLTRRASEVSNILNELAANDGKWFSQGAKFEGLKLDTWFTVAELSTQIQHQLQIGMSLHVNPSVSFY
jgi:hypothetical protein